MVKYRGISLMSVAAKTYNWERSYINQIHVIPKPLESANDKQLPLYITFADFKKAFYSINRKVMTNILKHYGLFIKTVQTIEAIYHSSRSEVLVNDDLSKEFVVMIGVLQGDVLVPSLFIIMIDYIIENAELDYTNEKGEYGFVTNLHLSSQDRAITIYNLDFIDNIDFLEHILERAQMQLIATAKRASELGIQVNTNKLLVVTFDEATGKIQVKQITYHID
jgi:hypothetical protein